MIHSLLATEYEDAGESVYHVAKNIGQHLLMYAPITSRERSVHPGDVAALWAHAFQASCGKVLWPDWRREDDYGRYEPEKCRQFSRLCHDAISRGHETVISGQPVRFETLASLIPSLWHVRDLEVIEKELPRLDVLTRLSLPWVYLVGCSNPYNTPWTLLQADDPLMIDSVLTGSAITPTHKVLMRHPRAGRNG